MSTRFQRAMLGVLLALVLVVGNVVAQDDAAAAGVYEGADLTLSYPESGWTLTEGTDVLRLESNGASIVLYGPTSYANVLGDALFANDNADALAFFLERVGYTVGDAADDPFEAIATQQVALPRRNTSGFASLVDLGFERQAVVISLSEETVDLELDAAVVQVADSLTYIPNLVELASSLNDFSTLVAAVEAADLAGTLASGEYTVFAPTNDAFAAALETLGITATDLLGDTETLTNILLYHVVEGSVLSTDLAAGEVATLLEGASVTISLEDGVMVNDATVTTADVIANNGVIHVIDTVLMPVFDVESDAEADMTQTATEEPAPPTIVDVVVDDRSFSLLEEAVVSAGLAETLAADGPFTVFAPTNRAFMQAVAALGLTPEGLLANTDLLTDILLYHVVEGAVLSSELSDGEVATLLGETVTISLADGVQVNNANVTSADIQVANGVIHVVDAVLVPQSVFDAMAAAQAAEVEAQMAEAAAQAMDVAEATFEGDFEFAYPEEWALDEGSDLVSLTLETASILVSGPDNYAALLGDVALGSDAEALAFFLDRSGYTVGEAVDAGDALAALSVTLPRRDQSGTALLLDLENGRQGVVVGMAQADPFAAARDFAVDAIVASLTYPPNIADIVVADPEFDILEQALGAAGLVETLAGDGPFTVFAPTGAAFQAALGGLGLNPLTVLGNPELLEAILLYHVVDGAVFSSDLTEGDVATLQGESVSISLADGVMVNNANVTTADVEASNGVIHVIDSVLLPEAALETITLLQAVQAADATYEGAFSFNYPDEFTLTEGSDIVTTTLSGVSVLVSGPDNYANLIGDVAFDTTAEEFAFFLERSGYTVNNATTRVSDALAAFDVELPRRDQVGVGALYDLGFGRVGAVIGLTDTEEGPTNDLLTFTFNSVAESLVYPPNIADIVVADPEFDILEQALGAAGLVETLAGDGPFTVFAPTGAAFQAALGGLGLNPLTVLGNPELLEAILLYHVVDGAVFSSDLTEGDVATLQGESVTISLADGVMVNNANVTTADVEASNGVIHVIDSVLLPEAALQIITLLQATQAADATYEGAFSFNYPDEFTLTEGSDIVTTTLSGVSVLVSGPDNYANLIGDVAFDTTAEEFAFFLERSGYTVGDPADVSRALAAFNVELPRRNQSGVAALYDLNYGRVGAVIGLSDAAEGPAAAAQTFAFGTVANSLVYPPNIVDLVVDDTRFSLLEEAVVAAGLADTLAGAGPFTVFAPSNDAFVRAVTSLGLRVDDVIANTDLLQTILLYHVVEGAVRSTDLAEGDVATLQGESVSISLADGVMVNDATVTTADVEASNGVIHVIDTVLLPEAAFDALAVADVAAAANVTYDGPDFSFDYPETFDLTEGNDVITLTTRGASVLVSGPTNYATILGTVEQETDADALAFFLDRSGYTVGDPAEVDGAIAAFNVELPRRGQTGVASLVDLDYDRQGVVIALSSNDTLAAAANTGAAAVSASIDYPPNVADLVIDGRDLNLLQVAVERAGLVDTLAGAGPFTVFAPTNAAFQATLADLGITLDDLIANTDLLTQILQLHVVEGAATRADLADGPLNTLLGEAVTVDAGNVPMINDATIVSANLRASNGIVHIIDRVLLPLGLTISADASYTDDYRFDYSSAFELTEGTDIVLMTNRDSRVLVSGPTNFDTIAGNVALGTTDADFRFFLNRSGYTVGDATTYAGSAVAFNVELPRRNESGVAALIDLGFGQRAAVVSLGQNPDDSGLVANTRFVVDSLRLLTIAEIARTNPNFTVLRNAIVGAGLEDALDGDGNFTVFAPTDDAFQALLAELQISQGALLGDTDLLATVVAYHALNAGLPAERLTPLVGADIPTLLPNNFLNVDVIDGGVVVNDEVNVVTADVFADNGVIHVVDQVLLPADTALMLGVGGQCVVSTQDPETLVRVGPGFNRVQIDFLPVDASYPALSVFQDANGNIWYELDETEAAPGKLIDEAWVLSTDVDASIACPQ